jgi:hypothetical protein
MDTLQTIELCQNLFYVFAGVAAVGLVLAVYLFFKFDIPYTYSMLTGKARKRTIEQMEKQKFQTGRLRMSGSMGHTGNPSRLTKKPGKTGETMTGTVQSGSVTAAPEPELAITAPMRPADITAPLADGGHPDTQVLHSDVPETQDLCESKNPQEEACTQDLGKTAPLKTETDQGFQFRITEETLCVNTDELI